VRVVKNKVAPPFRVAEFDIMYNEGISKAGDLLDIGVETELIEKRGSYYSYGETRLGQGRENAKQYLRENPELAQEIETEARVAADLRPLEYADDGYSPDQDQEEVEEAEAEVEAEAEA
jgi:recombination protein RecA